MSYMISPRSLISLGNPPCMVPAGWHTTKNKQHKHKGNDMLYSNRSRTSPTWCSQSSTTTKKGRSYFLVLIPLCEAPATGIQLPPTLWCLLHGLMASVLLRASVGSQRPHKHKDPTTQYSGIPFLLGLGTRM